MLAQQTGATLVKWPLTADKTLCCDQLEHLLSPRTWLVAVTQMSNVTGCQPDIARAAQLAHQHGALIVADGAQGVVHRPLNVTLSDVDFYAFSAHKLYGPNGLGVLYGRPELLSDMQPWQGGGKMLTDTDFFSFTWLRFPPVLKQEHLMWPVLLRSGKPCAGWIQSISPPPTITPLHCVTVQNSSSRHSPVSAVTAAPAARCWPLISMVFITVISPRCWRKKYRPAPRAALCAAAVSGAGHGRLSAGLLYAV